MITLPPICYVDALGFGDSITLTLNRNYTSPDGFTTITGTVTFTWHRTLLAHGSATPKSPCADYGFSEPATKGKFLAVSCANGRMPGWLLFFGEQDPITDAYTVINTNPPFAPVVTHQDAEPPSLTASTCKVAPNRPIMATALISNAGGDARIIGINSGVNGGTVHSDDTPITVELLRAQQAATDTVPAVGPLYRVSIPADCDLSGRNANGGFLGDSAYVIYDGQHYPPPDGNGFTEFSSLDALPGEVHYRSSHVADVLLGYGHTLAAGSIPGGYVGFAASDAVTLNAYNPVSLPIANPFPMQGQHFSHGPDDSGTTMQVQF